MINQWYADAAKSGNNKEKVYQNKNDANAGTHLLVNIHVFPS